LWINGLHQSRTCELLILLEPTVGIGHLVVGQMTRKCVNFDRVGGKLEPPRA